MSNASSATTSNERRLSGLVQIGVDEVSYRKGQRCLTTADHCSGAIVWMRPGRNAQTLQALFVQLGERKGSTGAVSIDMAGGYEKAVREAVPQAEASSPPEPSTMCTAQSETRRASRRQRAASGSRARAGRS